jgi:hypothetical protein
MASNSSRRVGDLRLNNPRNRQPAHIATYTSVARMWSGIENCLQGVKPLRVIGFSSAQVNSRPDTKLSWDWSFSGVGARLTRMRGPRGGKKACGKVGSSCETCTRHPSVPKGPGFWGQLMYGLKPIPLFECFRPTEVVPRLQSGSLQVFEEQKQVLRLRYASLRMTGYLLGQYKKGGDWNVELAGLR